MIRMMKMKNTPRYPKEKQFPVSGNEAFSRFRIGNEIHDAVFTGFGELCKHSDYKNIMEHLFGDLYLNSTQLKENCHFTFSLSVNSL